jgi:hypothetical protein
MKAQQMAIRNMTITKEKRPGSTLQAVALEVRAIWLRAELWFARGAEIHRQVEARKDEFYERQARNGFLHRGI